MTSTETITISKAEYITMQNEVIYLKKQLADLKRMIFGAKSERYIPADQNQPTLFELPVEEVIEQPKEQISYTRTKPENKKQPVRVELPGQLPRVTEIIEPEGLAADAKRLNCIIRKLPDGR